MRKTKKQCREALDFYIGEIKRLYPSARAEVLPDTMSGFDALVDVEVPARSVVAATRKFADLEIVVSERFGISLATLTGELGRAA